MDKQEHGDRLKAAIARARMSRERVADAVGVKSRTVTNWTSGTTMPQPEEREQLRVLFPGYDEPGDEVESAIRRSELIKWRQDRVLSEYERNLHEQRREETG